MSLLLNDIDMRERRSAAAVINFSESVIYAVERSDYQAAASALNVARMNLEALLIIAEQKVARHEP